MTSEATEHSDLRKSEWLTFFFFTLILLPAIAVAFVGTYGFAIWMSHEIYGPPTVAYEAAQPATSDSETGGPSVPPTDGARE